MVDDKIFLAVQDGLRKRYEIGLETYGVPFSASGYTVLGALKAAMEEALDQVFYLQKAIIDLEKNGVRPSPTEK